MVKIFEGHGGLASRVFLAGCVGSCYVPICCGMSDSPPNICNVLSLDGGGAKGFYTLGILSEVEALVGRPLHEHFHLIFGTSTGAIIAALLATGRSVAEVQALYAEHVVNVMRPRSAAKKSAALEDLAKTVFGTATFRDVKTGIGIVATRWSTERPMIFKGSVAQALSDGLVV
jgi:uncharacterized protein